MNPDCSGNTTPSQQSTSKKQNTIRARAFQFTLNEVDKWPLLQSYLDSLRTCDYYIACKELAPTTNHEHIHCYAHFSESRNISIKKCVGAHIEKCRGSPQSNIAYIEKDGNIIAEKGDRPHQGYHTVKDLEQIEDPSDLKWNEYNTWLKIKNRPRKIKLTELYKQDLQVIYITGPSGCGKSKKAYELVKEHGYDELDQIAYHNQFYEGISDGKGCAVYDDFRPSDMKASEFIKLIDYNSHPMNIKGGSIMNQYNLIIITSIIEPRYLYMNLSEEAKEQWLRRIKIINYYSDNYNIDIGET